MFSVKISDSCFSSCLDLCCSVAYFCIFFSSLLGLLVRLDLFLHWCGLCPLDWHSVHINAADGRWVLKAKIHFSQGGFVLCFCWFSPVLLRNSLILKSNSFIICSIAVLVILIFEALNRACLCCIRELCEPYQLSWKVLSYFSCIIWLLYLNFNCSSFSIFICFYVIAHISSSENLLCLIDIIADFYLTLILSLSADSIKLT